MTREQFITEHIEGLCGLLLLSLAEAAVNRDMCHDGHAAIRGRFMMAQMKRGRELLGLMYDSLNLKPDGAANGRPQTPTPRK